MACQALPVRGFLQTDAKDPGTHAIAHGAHCDGCGPAPTTERAEPLRRQIIREGGGINAPTPQRIIAGASEGASVDLLSALPERVTLGRKARGAKNRGRKRHMPPLWVVSARTATASRNSDSRRGAFTGPPSSPSCTTAGHLGR